LDPFAAPLSLTLPTLTNAFKALVERDICYASIDISPRRLKRQVSLKKSEMLEAWASCTHEIKSLLQVAFNSPI
jgi:hypothetical protein